MFYYAIKSFVFLFLASNPTPPSPELAEQKKENTIVFSLEYPYIEDTKTLIKYRVEYIKAPTRWLKIVNN